MLMKKIQSTDLSLEMKLSSTANINIYFGQERPDWAKEDFRWACRSSKNENIKEDLRHAVFSCPALEGKRTIVLTKFRSVTETIIPATF